MKIKTSRLNEEATKYYIDSGHNGCHPATCSCFDYGVYDKETGAVQMKSDEMSECRNWLISNDPGVKAFLGKERDKILAHDNSPFVEESKIELTEEDRSKLKEIAATMEDFISGASIVKTLKSKCLMEVTYTDDVFYIYPVGKTKAEAIATVSAGQFKSGIVPILKVKYDGVANTDIFVIFDTLKEASTRMRVLGWALFS